jgi:hypothetical protein
MTRSSGFAFADLVQTGATIDNGINEIKRTRKRKTEKLKS